MNWKKVFLYSALPMVIFLLSIYITIEVLLKTSENVICPDVRGKTIEEARSAAEARGFFLHVVKYEQRNDIPYNHITVQKPEANIATKRGRTINVIVSEGPRLVEVPILTGRPLEDAEKIARDGQFEIENTVQVPHHEAGKVLAQLPRGGGKVLEGKGLILLVGTGRNKYFLMPEVNNINITGILEEMESNRIKYNIVYLGGEYITSESRIRPSVPPRSIFSAEDPITINVINGG